MKLEEIIKFSQKIKNIYGGDFKIEVHEISDGSRFYFVLKKNTRYGELLFLLNHNHLDNPFSAKITIDENKKNLAEFLKGIE